MPHEEFLHIALDLFGESWAYEISKRLNLNIRTVQRFASGKREVPDAVAGILRFWAGANNGQ